ncbi:MAG: hypothetical protein K6V97_04075 [Actinomycetia bacterium]|nr:hypothetical protein [Actinomycetes bacterium]
MNKIMRRVMRRRYAQDSAAARLLRRMTEARHRPWRDPEDIYWDHIQELRAMLLQRRCRSGD